MHEVMPGLSSDRRARDARFGLLAALGATFVWFAALMAAPDIGVVAYLAPAALLVGLVVFAIGRAVLRTGDIAVLVLLFVATLGLNLTFRNRVAGETGLDEQNVLKLVAWAFMTIATWVERRRVVALVAGNFGCLLALAFCVAAALSTLWSEQPALTAASAFGLLASLGFACVTALRLSSVTVQSVMVFALGGEILLGLLAFLVAPSVALMEPSEGEVYVRLQGLSGHPNLLGEHAALLLVVLAGVWEARALPRKWLIPLGLAAAIALIASGSRTAAIAAVAAIAIQALRCSRWRRQVFLAAMCIGVLVALIGALGLESNLSEALSSLTRSGNASEIATLTGRTDLWAIAWEHFLERPFLGWGFNATEALMLNSVGADFVGNAVNAHNAALQALMTTGLLGSLPVLGFIACLAHAYMVNPDAARDRLFVFLLVFGVAEAELMTLPMISIFLCFWCLARNAIDRHNRMYGGLSLLQAGVP